MNNKLFAFLCGIIASFLFFLISLFSYQIGREVIATEYFIFAAGIMIAVTIFSSIALNKEVK